VATDEQYLTELTPDTARAVRQLLSYGWSIGLPVEIICGLRTCEEQDELYAQGRTAPGRIVTGVPGCRSWHVHGRAVDLYAGGWDPELYYELGRYWQELGGVWGGAFNDYGHFEYHPGLVIGDVCPDESGRCAPRAVFCMAGVGIAAAGVLTAGWLLSRSR
jgi:peptidoglycan L-alanyl-D-glutamate endopeptidase CwlK